MSYKNEALEGMLLLYNQASASAQELFREQRSEVYQALRDYALHNGHLLVEAGVDIVPEHLIRPEVLRIGAEQYTSIITATPETATARAIHPRTLVYNSGLMDGEDVRVRYALDGINRRLYSPTPNLLTSVALTSLLERVA